MATNSFSDDEDDGLAEDYRAEQSYHDSVGRPQPRDGLVARYWWGYDCPDSTTCDKVYIDRVTGREVGRYDAADPANTRFDYGATTDADWFASMGLRLSELVRPEDCTLTEAECAARMAVSYDDCYDDYDDYPEEDDYYDYPEEDDYPEEESEEPEFDQEDEIVRQRREARDITGK